MIGSFWNLCRACPSMPVDKLHSEYRSTYRWHEFAASAKQDVVRRPPAPNQFAQSNEPPLPRRKKCPELAYKSHEFIIGSEYTGGDVRNSNSVARARPEERGTPSRRSKSEGPHGLPNGRVFPISSMNETDGTNTAVAPGQTGESSGLFKKTISKLSTEYRLQFVWPRKTVIGQSNDPVEYPRKSISMNAIKSTQTNPMPTVHKKRTANRKEAAGAVHELEPLVNNLDEKRSNEKQVTITEPKSSRPFSQAIDQERNNHFVTKRENFGFEEQKSKSFEDNKAPVVYPISPYNNEQWYQEVIALRKKAGEYKSRGWGIEIDPELYKKQRDLWDQVSKRSSLSALSLATTVRPITKEEKDQENNKKSFPLKKSRDAIDNRVTDEPILPVRVHTIRHHLERTTGPDVEEGALLPSPTREKLMPAIPKRDCESQRGSPKKSVPSRHGSPQKGSPQKGSPKKTFKVRSQSMGPAVLDSNESPKRQLRVSSTAPAAPANVVTSSKIIKKPGSAVLATPHPAPDRKPRPSTLSTSIHSRSKSSSLAPSASRDQHSQKTLNSSNKTKPSSTSVSNAKGNKQKGLTSDNVNNLIIANNLKNLDKKLAEHDGGTGDSGPHETAVSISSCSPHLVPEVAEHIVKSPPEPTRVKSPEQIIMRSPDPVNWTVPLDTGKTFTVTQNVKEGESISRPQSEVKASTPIDRALPAIHSAPPELAEQAKLDAWKNAESKKIDGKIYDKPIPGTTIRCLDDPLFENDAAQQQQRNNNITTPVTTAAAANNPTTTTAEVLEKARDRFDRFWGNTKEDNV